MVAPPSTLTSDQVMNYTALKNIVIQQLEEVCYEKWELVLHRYVYVEPRIISDRTLSKLRKSPKLEDLIEILEHRDCLSPDNVSEFINLADFLRRPRVSCDVEQYRQYRKLEGIEDSITNTVCVCGSHAQEFGTESTTTIPTGQRNSQGNYSSVNECPCLQTQNDLDEAIARVSPNIIEDWPRLARALNFREGDIDRMEWEVEERAVMDGMECASHQIICQMFVAWKQRQQLENREASAQKLKAALVKARLTEVALMLN